MDRVSGALRRLAGHARAGVPSAAFLTGVGMVGAGTGLIFLPAGLIVGGVLLAAVAFAHERGRR